MPYCPKHCYVRHYGTPHKQCASPTKTNRPCPHNGDREHPETGLPVCHVHDPNGRAQENFRKAKAG